jgi:ankyrin repeat protein
MVIALLMNGYESNVRDTFNQTPLSLAAANKCEAVVTVLLAVGSIDPNSKDKYGRTPLS